MKKTKKALTDGVEPQNRRMHKAVKQRMRASYTKNATKFKGDLEDLKENAQNGTQKRGFEKLANRFDDVSAKAQGFVDRKRGSARSTAIPPRVLQVRQDFRSNQNR